MRFNNAVPLPDSVSVVVFIGNGSVALTFFLSSVPCPPGGPHPTTNPAASGAAAGEMLEQ